VAAPLGRRRSPRLSEAVRSSRLASRSRSRDVEYRHDGQPRSWPGAASYEPVGRGFLFPALLEVHGGAWNNNDRMQNDPLNQGRGQPAGIVVVAIRLSDFGADGALPRARFCRRQLRERAG